MTPPLFLRSTTTGPSAPFEACLAVDGVDTLIGPAPLEALAQRAASHPVVVFVPAADTLSLAVTLPPMSASKARAALPFALEDQLAGDLEHQHFALGARLPDGRWPVRVVARARLEGWLKPLRDAGIEPQAVVADADTLRDKPGDLMLWLDGDEAHWRAPGQPPVSLPAEALAEGPALALGDVPQGTLGLRVHGTPAGLARYSAAIEAVGRGSLQVAAQALPEGALPWLAAQHDPARTLNLLQGEYAPVRARRAGSDAWRWPLRLAAVAVALQVIGWGLEAWRLQRAAAPVDAALIEAARPLGPAVEDADAARGLIRSRLADWDRRERDPSRSPLVQAASTIIDARVAAPGLTLLSLRQSEDGTVAARFEAGDAPSLQSAREALLAAGWTEQPGAAGTGLDLSWRAAP